MTKMKNGRCNPPLKTEAPTAAVGTALESQGPRRTERIGRCDRRDSGCFSFHSHRLPGHSSNRISCGTRSTRFAHSHRPSFYPL